MGLDPNDFVDADEVFEDDYDADEITYANFVIVPGPDVNYTSLVFNAEGIYGPSGRSGSRWGINMYYGYRYNGDAIPIAESHAEYILDNIGDHDHESFDWAAQNWTYFE